MFNLILDFVKSPKYLFDCVELSDVLEELGLKDSFSEAMMDLFLLSLGE